MNRLVIASSLLLDSLRRLRTQSLSHVTLAAGSNCLSGKDAEFLATQLNFGRERPIPSQRLRIEFADHFNDLPAPAQDVHALLRIGRGPSRGLARGSVRVGASVEALDELRVVGSPGGLQKIRLLRGAGHPGDDDDLDPAAHRWSRTIGALGMGVFDQIRSLRCVVVGTGRTGSFLALLLARLGVEHLTLVDFDRVEPHNVGETWVLPSDVGRLKVEAVADACRRHDAGHTSVKALPVSVTQLPALAEIAGADFVFSTPDDNSARLATAALAALFLKPMLDIGSGIFTRDGRREMGCDLRLLNPGRCILCTGGLAEERRARDALRSADLEVAGRQSVDWRLQRAGSLASVSATAVGIAVRLLEDYLGRRLQDEATWLRLAWDESGLFAASDQQLARASGNCFCRFAGCGEEGLPSVISEFRSGKI